MTGRIYTFAFAMLVAFLPITAAAADDELHFLSLSSGKMTTLAGFRGHPVLIAFWRADCAPCRAEKPILQKISREHATLPVVIISLQDETHTRKAFAEASANIQVLVATDDAERTLHTLGDANAALPYSVFLRKGGTACQSRTGLLGTHIVDEWVKQCST